MLLPLVTLPARFSARGVWTGLAVAVVVLLASTVAFDPAGFAADPTYMTAGAVRLGRARPSSPSS